ncbi:MAG: hypothetical protein J7L54_07455 [Elusimicrobia bacterium]|nr:hypothetical protein [Elusimicrobiota bacterium]
MSYGEYFAVGRARVYENYLLPPAIMKRAFDFGDFSKAKDVFFGFPFGAFIDEKKDDFGLTDFLDEVNRSFGEISAGRFCTASQRRLAAFLKERNLKDVLEAMENSDDPFEFYAFLWSRRLALRGEVEGEDVLFAVWMCLFYQIRLARMILKTFEK